MSGTTRNQGFASAGLVWEGDKTLKEGYWSISRSRVIEPTGVRATGDQRSLCLQLRVAADHLTCSSRCRPVRVDPTFKTSTHQAPHVREGCIRGLDIGLLSAQCYHSFPGQVERRTRG